MTEPVIAEPTWTILVPTIGQRRDLFVRLMDVLLPQVEAAGGRVRVVAYWNNGAPPLPVIRQRMVQATTTDYLSCVDDDDLVPNYYVAEVLAALTTRPDYVGWQVQCYESDRPTAISYHDLRNQGWRNDVNAYYRDFSHLNPIRAELARRADFRKARRGWPEDRAWAQQLRDLAHDWSQVYIDRVMYHYLYDPKSSAWRRPTRIGRTGLRRTVVDHPYFTWHPECPGA